MSRGGVDATVAPTEHQIQQLTAIGLRVPRTCTGARNLINYFDRAKIGVKDDARYLERVQRFKEAQDKWLGKRVRMASGDPGRQNGRVLDVVVTPDGNLQYTIDWGKLTAQVWQKSGLMLKPD